jgi:hypothetical protein
MRVCAGTMTRTQERSKPSNRHHPKTQKARSEERAFAMYMPAIT